MNSRASKSRLTRKEIVLLALTVAVPAMLAFSALRTYRALDEQRGVYLRSHAASIAQHLETIPATTPHAQWKEELLEEDGSLLDVELLERAASPSELADLWEGRELFRTEAARRDGEAVFRSFVPVHTPNGLRMARIDLAENSAEFLTEHALHHLWLVGMGALMIVAFSLAAAMSSRRAARAERKQLELQHLASLGEMSAVLAHEIRNPLGTIKGFAQLLAEKKREEPTALALIDPILSESSRLEGLVRDLLLWGRAANPVFEDTGTEEVASVVRQHASQLIDPGSIQFEIDVEPLKLRTDPRMLEQVMLNLLRNSIDAVRGKSGAKVRLEAKSLSSGAAIRIIDNGPGLSAEALNRLYEPFFTSKASGTGLGLSISRKLVEALGGTLRLENNASGGLTAEVSLPSAEARA